MKKILTLCIALFAGMVVTAQVSKAVIVEHFTNSKCGICASKNPGLLQNLANHPDVMHISFHPSSPYSTCIFSQHNPVENDDRTKFYSIFGGTPWIVINGQVQSSGTNFGNPALFNPFYGQTSPFYIFIKEYRFEDNNIQVDITIKAVSEHALEQASLFAGFAEDTVFYEAPNGEDPHTDVFRKALTEVEGEVISLPMTGDSVTLTYNVIPNPEWNIDRMYTMAILQETSSKILLQAGKTDIIEFMDPSFIGNLNRPEEHLRAYPNPASGSLITVDNAEEDVMIFSADGRLINSLNIQNTGTTTLDISALQNGIYILKSAQKMKRLVVVR
jgi:hypothetical protein